MAYGSIYSTSRITGLSSGLDTDQLVKAAMMHSQSKLDRLYQQKTSLEWKRDAYTDIRKKASDFSSKYFSALSSDNIFSKSAYKQFKVSVSDKYSSFFSIKGTSNAQAGNHTISQTKLAKSALLTSSKRTAGKISVSGATDNNKAASMTTKGGLYVKEGDNNYRALTAADLNNGNIKLDDIYTDAGGANKAFNQQSGSYTFSYRMKADSASDGFKTVSLKNENSSGGATLKDLSEEFGRNGLTMSVGDGGKVTFQSKQAGNDTGLTLQTGFQNLNMNSAENKAVITASTKLSDLASYGKSVFDSNGKMEFKINGITFSTEKESSADGKVVKIGKDDTIQSVMDKVNDSGAKVKMTLNDSGFRIQNTDADSKELSIENVAGKFFGNSGDKEDTNSVTGIRAQTTKEVETLDRAKDTIASAAAKMGVEDSIANGVLTFELQAKDGSMKKFEFDANTTLDKMMSKINSDSDLAVKMSYSQITDKFTIESKETGNLATVKMQNSDKSKAMDFFGITPGEGGVAADTGEDAMIQIDGETIYKSSNTFTLDGMEITIKGDWKADEDNADMKVDGAILGKARISVEQDIDATVDKVKAFVTAYNELVDSLYGTISEEKDYDYEPLTEDAKAELEKEDIEKWETEAKKGLLRNDTTIRSYLSRMRMAMFEKVGGTSFSNITGSDKDREGLSAYDLGFNTTSYETGKYGGRITFDEKKFRAALERDPEAVANVMAQVSEATDKDQNYSDSGFATKLFDITSDFINTLRGTNIQNTNKKITDLNKDMDNLLDKMKNEQERLYQQYAQLETLMTQYQNQSTWLTNQLASLTTG